MSHRLQHQSPISLPRLSLSDIIKKKKAKVSNNEVATHKIEFYHKEESRFEEPQFQELEQRQEEFADFRNRLLATDNSTIQFEDVSHHSNQLSNHHRDSHANNQ